MLKLKRAKRQKDFRYTVDKRFEQVNQNIAEFKKDVDKRLYYRTK